MASLKELLPFVLKWEGTEYTDHPEDDGGATKYGVTQNTLSQHRGKKVSKEEVKNLTISEAEEIYESKYWNLIRGEKLSSGVALIVFDGAVNHGVDRMVGFVQQAVDVNTTNKFDDSTLEAVKESNQFELVMKLSNLRRSRYTNHKDFKTFGKGWLNRLNDITNKALAFENKYVVNKPIEKIETIEEQKTYIEELAPDVDNTISNTDLQKFLASKKLYTSKIDGLWGAGSKKAADSYLMSNIGSKYMMWSNDRRKIAVGQLFAKDVGIDPGAIDGLSGEMTKNAFENLNYFIQTGEKLPNWRDDIEVVVPNINNNWPYYSELEKFYGKVGTNQVYLNLPYAMKLSWDEKTKISRFQCHEKVHDVFERIFKNVLSEYGEDKISELRLDVFGGCLNVRPMRGGSRPSMHSWGIAIDLDPINNQLKWDKNKASFAKNEYEPFWKIVESEGGVSLGRLKDYDWMHFEMTKGR